MILRAIGLVFVGAIFIAFSMFCIYLAYILLSVIGSVMFGA